jgi:hypothetical protein
MSAYVVMPHEFECDILLFRGKDIVVQPILQAAVVGDASQQAHGGVGVGVDQAGREDRIGPAQAQLWCVEELQFRARADGENAPVLHGDGPVMEHISVSVHCNHRAGGDQNVGRFGGPQRRRKQRREQRHETDGRGARPLRHRAWRRCRGARGTIAPCR